MNEDQLIERWFKIRRKDLLQIGILMVIIDVIVIWVLFLMPGSLEGESISTIIFGIICMVIFILLTIRCFVRWFKSFSWKVNEKTYGVVIEKKRHTDHRAKKGKNARGYYVDIIRNGETIEAKCDVSMYSKMNVQDEVLLIQVEKYPVYALK